MDSLQSGLLAPLRERVKADSSLCLELRENYANVYYRGGNLMRVSQADGGYAAFFDANYFEGVEPPLPIPTGRLREPADVAAWMAALPWLKQGMDLFLGRHPKDEREIEQSLLRENNFGGCARFDRLLRLRHRVRECSWAVRRRRRAMALDARGAQETGRTAPRSRRGEVRRRCARRWGGAPRSHRRRERALGRSRQRRRAQARDGARVQSEAGAGLIDCEKDLLGFTDDPPLLLLVLANHDPDKSRLRELFRSLPPSPYAELRVATGCLLGYGLYEPAVLTIEQALMRFEACI